MRYILLVLAFLITIGPGIARADGVAGTSSDGSSQGRLLPDVSFLPVARSYGEYLASIGHPPAGMSELPQSPFTGGAADMEVRGMPIQLGEVEAEKPTVSEHLAKDSRLPAGSYVKSEAGLDVPLSENLRLVGNDGRISSGHGEETFLGVGIDVGEGTVLAITMRIRGEAPEVHGGHPLPFGLTLMRRLRTW